MSNDRGTRNSNTARRHAFNTRRDERQDKSEKEAFDELLEKNGLECENYPWETDKEFEVWDKGKMKASGECIAPFRLHHLLIFKQMTSLCLMFHQRSTAIVNALLRVHVSKELERQF